MLSLLSNSFSDFILQDNSYANIQVPYNFQKCTFCSDCVCLFDTSKKSPVDHMPVYLFYAIFKQSLYLIASILIVGDSVQFSKMTNDSSVKSKHFLVITTCDMLFKIIHPIFVIEIYVAL